MHTLVLEQAPTPVRLRKEFVHDCCDTINGTHSAPLGQDFSELATQVQQCPPGVDAISSHQLPSMS